MYHLRLIKALSYSGIVRATRKNPDVYTDDKAIADMAVASGYFALVAELEVPNAETEKPSEDVPPADAGAAPPDYESLSKQTKAELAEYAGSHGISLNGCRTKSDILEAISAAHGGSYTMMELQKEV